VRIINEIRDVVVRTNREFVLTLEEFILNNEGDHSRLLMHVLNIDFATTSERNHRTKLRRLSSCDQAVSQLPCRHTGFKIVIWCQPQLHEMMPTDVRQGDKYNMTAKKIPDFESFVSSMEQCAELSALEPAAFTFLLEWVYAAAVFAKAVESGATLARRFPAPFRSERKAFSNLRVHLGKASYHLHKASELAPRQLSEALQHLSPEVQASRHDAQLSQEGTFHAHGDFDRIAIILRDAVNYARFREFLYSEVVHPSLRTPAEKKIMRERSETCAFPDYEEIPHISQIREKTPAQFHWFFGQVHSFFLGLESVFGPVNKVKNESRVIHQMFEVLFKEKTRMHDSVRKVLGRQRKSGIPDLIA
jgi:hypothetical protein